jgi:glucosylceramidase
MIAHASKFVRPGSVRIGSTNRGDATVVLTEDEERPGVKRMAVVENTQTLPNVAFRTAEGKIVLIVDVVGKPGTANFQQRALEIHVSPRFAESTRIHG